MTQAFIEHWSARLRFIDIHYHANPDSYLRRYTIYEAGQRYASAGGAVVIKNHLGSVSALATAMQDLGLPVFGSIVLNSSAGGLSITAVKQALSQYQFDNTPRLLVHLPTIVPTRHESVIKRIYTNNFARDFARQPLSISCDNGRLRPEIFELIEFARQHDIVLSSGHASKDQTLRLIEAVEKVGDCRLMLNQPANPITGFSAKELKALGRYDWLYIEQCALTLYLGYQTEEDMFEVLSDVNNVIYSSDLGQPGKPDIEQWLADSQNWFHSAGLTFDRIKTVTLMNPLKMLAPNRPLSAGNG